MTMAELVQKTVADLTKIEYAGPSDWTPYKDPLTGEVGNKQTGMTSRTLTVTHKDGTTQTHACGQNSTVTINGGMVQIRIP